VAWMRHAVGCRWAPGMSRKSSRASKIQAPAARGPAGKHRSSPLGT
jgi:hypothetical protein